VRKLFLGLAGGIAIAALSLSAAFPANTNSFAPVNGNAPVTFVVGNPVVGGPNVNSAQDASNLAAPTYVSAGCTTTPAIVGNPTSFDLTNGASGCGSNSTIVISLPAPATEWECSVTDYTTASVYDQVTARAAISAGAQQLTITNYTRTTGAAATMTASDVLGFTCTAH
jgi:hypothetical protein